MVAVAASPDPVHIRWQDLLRIGSYPALKLGAVSVRSPRSGPFLSPIRGRGMEFEESRPYSPGDDSRYLDWRVTARTGRAHTKQFREERERPIYLWLDLRRPMWFATQGAYKAVQASQAGALIAWSAAQSGDRLGALVFDEKGHQELRPRSGRAHLSRVLRTMADHEVAPLDAGVSSSSVSSLTPVLNSMQQVARPGSLILFLSDFRGLNEADRAVFYRLAQHCDLILIYFYDRLEEELPPPGVYRMGIAEKRVTLRVDAGTAQAHHARHAAHVAALEKLAASCSTRLISCRTDDDPLTVLPRYFHIKPGVLSAH